jgi:hypothetical protein
MTVIDKILNEWSFRCHDGIVDLNDPKKKAILESILKEYGISLLGPLESNLNMNGNVITNVGSFSCFTLYIFCPLSISVFSYG